VTTLPIGVLAGAATHMGIMTSDAQKSAIAIFGFMASSQCLKTIRDCESTPAVRDAQIIGGLIGGRTQRVDSLICQMNQCFEGSRVAIDGEDCEQWAKSTLME
jgi:hypothetical protein